MSRQEKRRRFNEAVINILYPPPPQPHEQAGAEPLSFVGEGSDAEQFSDELGLGEVGYDDDGGGGGGDGNDSGSQKLTRAQRKRIRRKKLKQDASRRRKIIGPFLPPQNEDEDVEEGNSTVGGNEPESEPPTIRCYAAEKAYDKPGETSTSANQSKLKQRRMAKKLARKSLKTSSDEDSHRNQNLGPADENQE